MSLIRNNPDIDYDALEAEVQRNVQRLKAAEADNSIEEPTDDAHGEKAPASGIESLEALYGLPDRDFIRAAYREFLKRDPDPEGEAHYLELLRSGIPKNRIAAALRYSPDGRRHPQRFNLVKARATHLLTRLPVAGRLFETLIAIAGIANLKKSVISLQRQADDTRGVLSDLHGQITRLYDDINDMEYELNQQRLTSVAELEKRLIETESRLEQDLRALRLASSTARHGNEPTATSSATGEVPLEADFYHRFEEHFRGPPSLVKQRMAYYLPVLQPKLDAIKPSLCVDIGCGRGEWLSLLKENGYTGKGIDQDGNNVDHCQNDGLDVELGNGISWLTAQKSNCLALVTAFHVAEHLPFGALNRLLAEALRTLVPGGIVLLETPNPENLNTAAHLFYTDPTHRAPLPPVLMEFLLDYRGFTGIEVHRLHPARETAPTDSGNDVTQMLFGPQDYAILARKG